MVFVTLPTCPTCGSTKYKRSKSESTGEGSSLKKVGCRECGTRYKIVLELPETGNGECGTW
jgi:transcriptional regulator NrdR family protein